MDYGLLSDHDCWQDFPPQRGISFFYKTRTNPPRERQRGAVIAFLSFHGNNLHFPGSSVICTASSCAHRESLLYQGNGYPNCNYSLIWLVSSSFSITTKATVMINGRHSVSYLQCNYYLQFIYMGGCLLINY